MPKESCSPDCPLISRPEVRFRRGTLNQIVIVGQSPALNEVERNEPFVGRSGILLKNVVAHVGVQEQEITLANALRCPEGIPGLTGKNLTTALKSCRGRLSSAIQTVSPNLIVTLGSNALKTVLNKGNVQQNRGKFFRSEEFNCDVFVMLHPAAIMREQSPGYPHIPEDIMNPKEKMFLQDWKTVKTYMDNNFQVPDLSIDTRGYKEGTIADWQELRGSGPAFLGVDIETTGLNPRDSATRILSIGISDRNGKSLVYLVDPEDYEHEYGFQIIKELLENRDIIKYVASRPFDENFLRVKLGINMVNVNDVLTMAHIVDENYHSFSLENVASIYTGMHNIKEVSEGMRATLIDAPVETLIRYQGVDSDATLRSANNLNHRICSDFSISQYFNHFIRPVQNMLARVSNHGVRVDQAVLNQNIQQAQALLEELSVRFMSFVTREVYEKHEEKGHKLSRNAFLKDALFSRNGLRINPLPMYQTESTKEPQMTEEHLKELLTQSLTREQEDAIQTLMRWKKLNKIVTSYLTTIQEHIQEDGCIYPSTSLIRTVTGRSVMLNPAIQTFPARGEFAPLIRSAIVPTGSDKVLMTFDLAQSELRIMGWLADDKEVLNALRSGVDLHTRTAAAVNHVSVTQVTKQMRNDAKGVNFGLVYGMQAPNFREYLRENYNLRLSLEECVTIRENYFRTYSGIRKYHDRVQREVKKRGFVMSPLGRKRRLPGVYSPDRRDQSEAFRQAINSPIQSFSSDLGFICMMLLDEWARTLENPSHVRVLWFIHDAVILEVHRSMVRDTYEMINKVVREDSVTYIRSEFGVEVNYPVECDVKIGESWATMVDYFKWFEAGDPNGLIL